MSRWLVWEPEAGGTRDDAATVDAENLPEAAETYCRDKDSRWAEYPDERLVMVARDDAGSADFLVRVSAELVRRYSGEILTEKERLAHLKDEKARTG